MTLYTIRPDFTIWKNGIIYAGGDEIDLSSSEVEAHKHKLEGISSNVIPLNLPSAIGSYDDAIPQLGATNYQTAIAALDARVDAIEPTIAPLAPSFTVFIDGTNGNDNNDGFVLPIKTTAKLQQIVDSYNWQGNELTISIANNPPIFLSGYNLPSFSSVLFTGNNTVYTQDIAIAGFFVLVAFVDFLFQGLAQLSANDCSTVFLSSSCRLSSLTGGFFAEILDVKKFSIQNVRLENTNNSSLTVFSCSNIDEVSIDPGVFNSVIIGNYLNCIKVKNLILTSATGSITGKVLSLANSGFINISRSGWNLTGSVADTFPEIYALNFVFFDTNLYRGQAPYPYTPASKKVWEEYDSNNNLIETWVRDSTNTYWLSKNEYQQVINVDAITTGRTIKLVPSHDITTNLFLLRHHVVAFFTGTLTNLNYWTFQLQRASTANALTNIAQALSTQNLAANNYVKLQANLNLHIDIAAVNFGAFNSVITEVGDGGNLTASILLIYKKARI